MQYGYIECTLILPPIFLRATRDKCFIIDFGFDFGDIIGPT